MKIIKLILTLLLCLLPACGWGVSLVGSGVVNNEVSYTLYWSADAAGSIEYPTSLSATLNDDATIVSGGVINSFVQTDDNYHGNASILITNTQLDADGVFRLRAWIRQPTDGSESYIFSAAGQTGEISAIWQGAGSLIFKYGSDTISWFSGGGEFELDDATWYHFEFYADNTLDIQGIRCLNRNCADDGAGNCEAEESISNTVSGSSTSITLAGANSGTSTMDMDEIYFYATEE